VKKTAALEMLGALAQENRLDTFRLLVQAGPAGMAAGEIATELGLPAPTLSFHLAQLRNAGLVDSRRDGRSLVYSVSWNGMDALMAFLSENCCRGSRCAPPRKSAASNSSLRNSSRSVKP
jgi:DNA-binding transcriptional ArsR family regulator